ncbi:hypothetical protein D021_3089B, partial [Vibrio parahaemolyticus 10296]
SKISKNRD